jgi:hypothetical protein
MIEILLTELTDINGSQHWVVWLQITQNGECWMLPTTAPGTLAENELQAHFEAQEDELWGVAQEKQYTPDILKRVPSQRLLEAIALTMLDEFNVLRAEQGMPPLAEEEMIEIIKEKLISFT